MRLDQQSGGYENAYKYTGKELDAETDLYYYGARYYDAKIGRFVSVDPWFGDLSDPQSFNKYSYVRNNPLKYVDPSGEKVELIMRDLGNSFATGVFARHSFLYITPDNPEDFGLDSSFSFSLGGQDHGNLVGEMNNKGDLDTFSLDTINERATVDTPEGMTDTDFINTILDNYEWYNKNKVEFSSLSQDDGKNCHDYASAIIDWAGGEFPDIDPWTFDPGLEGSIEKPEGPLQKDMWKDEFNTKVVEPEKEKQEKMYRSTSDF